MRDEHRVRASWMLIPPALALLGALANVVVTDWGSVTLAFFLAALALGVAVGFAEELVCRGVLLVGLRGTFREVGAWALSCLVFGLMHTVSSPGHGSQRHRRPDHQLGDGRQHLLPAAALLRLPAPCDDPARAVGMSIFVRDFSGSEGTIFAPLEWPGGIVAIFAGLVALRTQRGAQEAYAASKATGVPATS